jgi:hypothetical protein
VEPEAVHDELAIERTEPIHATLPDAWMWDSTVLREAEA